MEAKVSFELDTVSNPETNVLAVKEFDIQLAKVNEILDKNPAVKITNDLEKKSMKEVRAAINHVIKEIDRRRIDDIELFTKDFTLQCNTLKNLLDTRQKELGACIKEYEDSQKATLLSRDEVKVYKATLKFIDNKVVEKLEKFAKANNCELEIK